MIISFDLETLSCRGDGAIVQIGAAAQAIGGGGKVYTFERTLGFDRIASGQEDAHEDPEAIAWWHEPEQNAALTSIIQRAPYTTRQDAIPALNNWILAVLEENDVDPTGILAFGNGATMDISTLEYAFRQQGLEPTWSFWGIRDLRTLKEAAELAGCPIYDMQDREDLHTARADAEAQLMAIQHYRNWLEKSAPYS